MPRQVGPGASIGGGLGGVRGSRLRAQRQRLASLKDSMGEVAARLRSDQAATAAQRTVLVTRFHDLQRRVNELDGIVSGEGQEARVQGQVAGAAVTPARPAGAEVHEAVGAAPARQGADMAPAPPEDGQGGQVDVVA